MKNFAAEFFGTFWLVFGGCGSAIFAAGIPELGIGYAGVALAFGLTVLTMAYAVGHISGGHFTLLSLSEYLLEDDLMENNLFLILFHKYSEQLLQLVYYT